MEKLLSRLIQAHGVSGNETQVRNVIIEAIQPLVDDVRVDSSGNVIAHKEGRDPNFMLAAHMDEIGLMVREIAPSGLLLCAAIGGVNPMSMVGTRVTIQGTHEVIHGIVTTRLISCGEEHEDVPGIEELVVDTGLGPKKLARLGVTVGAFLEPAKETNWLTYGNTISGKALDDRLGCYCLIEIARKLRRVKQEVFYVFTVQEEIGMHGAKTSAFSIRPRWALVIDVTAASDLRGGGEIHRHPSRPGQGTVPSPYGRELHIQRGADPRSPEAGEEAQDGDPARGLRVGKHGRIQHLHRQARRALGDDQHSHPKRPQHDRDRQPKGRRRHHQAGFRVPQKAAGFPEARDDQDIEGQGRQGRGAEEGRRQEGDCERTQGEEAGLREEGEEEETCEKEGP
jgi:putative aminopeptidase FrvX